eukprot:2738792-Amphidinium_carterae.1
MFQDFEASTTLALNARRLQIEELHAFVSICVGRQPRSRSQQFFLFDGWRHPQISNSSTTECPRHPIGS